MRTTLALNLPTRVLVTVTQDDDGTLHITDVRRDMIQPGIDVSDVVNLMDGSDWHALEEAYEAEK